MMNTAIFITIGTRDVVVSKEIDEQTKVVSKLKLGNSKENNYLLINPREDGKILLDYYENINTLINYPIIKPAIEEILDMDESGILDYVFLVYTDQKQGKTNIEDNFTQKDTLEFAEIIAKKIKFDFGSKVKSVKKIPVVKDVTFYDNTYAFFGKKFKELKAIKNLMESNPKIYVLPQGGINSINTALLLRCTEFFSDVIQLSKPEGFITPVKSSFPSLFKKNLTKERIIHAIYNFNYQTIIEYDYSELVTILAEYAYSRLTFNFHSARKKLFNYDSSLERQFIATLKNKTKEIEEVKKLRYKEWYLSCKISFHQKRYADFLLKIFNLAENILKPFAEEKLTGTIIYNAPSHSEWNALINQQDIEFKKFLNNYNVRESRLRLNSPNRFVYKAIFDYYTKKEDKLEYDTKIHNHIEKLTELRNNIGHNLQGVSYNDINDYLDGNLEEFISNLDEYFKLEEFGDFNMINTKIKSLL